MKNSYPILMSLVNVSLMFFMNFDGNYFGGCSKCFELIKQLIESFYQNAVK